MIRKVKVTAMSRSAPELFMTGKPPFIGVRRQHVSATRSAPVPQSRRSRSHIYTHGCVECSAVKIPQALVKLDLDPCFTYIYHNVSLVKLRVFVGCVLFMYATRLPKFLV